MDWPVTLCSGEVCCVVRNWVKLLACVDDIVLRQDASSCLVVGISFHNCLACSIKWSAYGS